MKIEWLDWVQRVGSDPVASSQEQQGPALMYSNVVNHSERRYTWRTNLRFLRIEELCGIWHTSTMQ